jgi:hypothetical protein
MTEPLTDKEIHAIVHRVGDNCPNCGGCLRIELKRAFVSTAEQEVVMALSRRGAFVVVSIEESIEGVKRARDEGWLGDDATEDVREWMREQ